MKFSSIKYTVVLAAAALAACSQPVQTESSEPAKEIPAPQVNFHTEGNPKSLSDWGILSSNGETLKLAQGSFIYELNTPLFSDYAHKLRTLYIPDGKITSLDTDNDRIIFPIGTIITKSFYYPEGTGAKTVTKSESQTLLGNNQLDISNKALIETRLLVRRVEGWIALPYVWNEDRTEARLYRTGDLQKFSFSHGGKKTEFAYLVPNVNQCAGCHATNHTTKEIVPIGPRLRHLTSIESMRIEQVPQAYKRNASWNNKDAGLNDRARAYLDINCSHCHSKVGPADTSGLHLEPETPLGANLGLCKTPIAAGTGTGNRKHGIVPGNPDASIFVYRMASINPAEMMPELGRALSHTEGVALIEEWIESLDGSCRG